MEKVMVKIKLSYHDLIWQNIRGVRDNLDYEELINCIPAALGNQQELANDGHEVRSLRVNGGILRIDNVQSDNEYIRFHFVKLNEGSATKSLDIEPGVQNLELPEHEFVSKHSVVVIDKNRNRVIFQNNRNVITEKMFNEVINFFWHRGHPETSILISEIADDPDRLARIARRRLLKPKMIEVSSAAYNRIQDTFDNANPINEAIRILSEIGGYTVNLTITKSRGGKEYYLDTDETNRFIADALGGENNHYSKANVVYDDDEREVSVLDLIGNKKKSEIDVETNGDGDFDWITVSNRFIEQNNIDFNHD